MTPMMSLFLRCLLALALMVVLLSLSDYSMAATPVETVHNALEPFGPQAGHFVSTHASMAASGDSPVPVGV